MNGIFKFCIVILLALTSYSCSNKSKERKTKYTKSDTVSYHLKTKENLDYLVNFSSESLNKSEKVFVKAGDQNDDGAVYLGADSNSITLIFGLNRCEYSFPCINENNKIKLKWNLEHGECDYKNLLSQTFGLRNYPKKNDIFAEIEPKGDSALRISYLFKEFINEQNRQGRENKEFKIDTLFPTIFKCSNCE